MSKLTIEIETEDANLISLLDHVRAEIKDPFGYRNHAVEEFADTKTGCDWLLIKDGPFKGKYKWNKR